MNSTILVIDDDEKLNKLLTEYFKTFNMETIVSTHPLDGLSKIKKYDPDLTILDVMLPDMDGFEVLKQIRKKSSIPVIMLTARGDFTDKVVGLEIGADDYLAKPFEPRELVARIQSVLRRASDHPVKKVKIFYDLTVDFEKRSASLKGEDLELTTNEFDVLTFLIENKGKVLNRDQILDELRGIDCEAFNRSIDIAMSRLRQKLKDDPKNPRFIKTIWGTGYLFIGQESS
jgi:DNA-binding response OmpR family regulator